MSTDVRLITAEEYAAMAIDHPTELVRGEIVEMTRPGTLHGLVCSNVTGALWSWARKTKAGRVIGNDAGVITETSPDTVRGPDVYFIRQERIPGGKLPSGWIQVPPDLCVEVLSPFDRWREVLEKVSEYFAAGVLEVWILDPEEQVAHVYRPDRAPAQLSANATLTSEYLPGFECGVDVLFEGC